MATFSQRVAAVRPTMRDVINLSRGEAATRRGLGSRRVPHRLNAEERKAYELAERKGFVAVIGSGMRRERKGSPLLNILRQRADALAQPLVWVEKASRGQTQDFACIDYSPLRLPDADALSTLHSRAIECATDGGEPRPCEFVLPIDAMPSKEQLQTLPIWALHWTVARFPTSREEEGGKASKRLAARLAREFGCVDT